MLRRDRDRDNRDDEKGEGKILLVTGVLRKLVRTPSTTEGI